LKLKRVTGLGFDLYDPIEPNDIFKFLQEEGNVDDFEMYKTFNMGMGFVIILPQDQAEKAASMTGGKVVGRITEKGIKVGDLVIAE
jgi:phosphoribosylformylglycinamidine cyclo-ligase